MSALPSLMAAPTAPAPGAARAPVDRHRHGWLVVPRTGSPRLGDIIRFCGQAFGDVFNGRVFHFFGEALRQAGILILGSALVIWGMVFILGLQCGIEGAYFNRSVGAPAYAGVFAAWCDLREMVPYMFGYIMAAKVGTGIVAELGAMRINEEIDALEVMGVQPDHVPGRHPPAGRLAGAAVHLHRRRRGRLTWPPTWRS